MISNARETSSGVFNSRMLDELHEVLGSSGLLTGEDVSNRNESWASHNPCRALAIVRPANTDQLSKVLALCHQHQIAVVPYGGGTGLVEGAVAGPDEILLSLERMRTIGEIDATTRTVTVDAGVTLQQLQDAVEEEGLEFPLDLGARGSATIGGNIATNAGGNRVIRFGMIREMILGLEAVLADGTVVTSLNRMLKNNAGYDLKQLFIGSEGTLGIVTRATLRLREKWQSQNAALLAVESFADVLHLLKLIDSKLGGGLSAFEVMWREFYNIVTEKKEGAVPLPRGHSYYVLVEALGGDVVSDSQRFEAMLAEIFETGFIADAVIATSAAQTRSFWEIRDGVEYLLSLGPIIMFDVSLPVSDMEGYVAEVRHRLSETWPDHHCIVWGHLGDSNLHLWITTGDASASDRKRVEEIVYSPLSSIGGSVSAEHGIGLEKRDYLSLTRSETEIALMRQLKKTLDPLGILNPGRIFNMD
jgi:FAD/FMN-containing dehydrogenase